MTSQRSLELTVRVAASAADARRGIVRAHPDVLLALGLREWDAIDIIGARSTAAVVAATASSAPSSLLIIDEVVSANCGLSDDSSVTVRPAAVTGATSITVQGLPATAVGLPGRLLRSALLGKVVRVGDAVTLAPRDLGPDFPTGDTTSSLRNLMGMTWSTQLLTVTATEPAGVVSIQPTTAVTAHSIAGPASTSAHSPPAKPGQLAGAPGPAMADGGHATPAQRAGSQGRFVGDHAADVAAIPHVPMDDLVGVRERAEVLAQWLEVALDRADVVRQLGASPHLGVLVSGPNGVGKATVVRSVCADRQLHVLDGPSVAAIATNARVDLVRARAAHARQNGGVLLVTDIDALLPAEPAPVSTMILDELRSVVAEPGVALVVTCVRPDDADPRLRAPEVCDRELELPLPSAAQRAELLTVLLRDVPADDLNVEAIADRTPGYVAADLRALVREAALRAAARSVHTPHGPEASNHSDPDSADTNADLPWARLRQQDLVEALEVIRPLSRTGAQELSLGSITLDDVGDMVEVRQVLTETVLWPLRHADSFQRLGVAPTRGVLLYGPPGCGKTFIVRALAASGQLTVHMVKGAELMSKWVGSSEKAVRDLFQRARDSAPSLVFLDELDALAPRRGNSGDSGVSDRVVASMLTELDGAEPLTGVVIVGATNRPDLIDPALLRPGRLEKLVFVPPPDAEARADILRAAGRDIPVAEGVDVASLAKDLEGYSAADCAALLREAALAAMRRNLDAPEVIAADIDTAIEAVRPSLDPVQVAHLQEYAQRRQNR